jgi:tetratricopeptide (TPR) repeat protein
MAGDTRVSPRLSRLLWTILAWMAIVVPGGSALAQPENVKGVVTDGEGRPVAGVGVELRATNEDTPIVQTTTNRDGEFELDANEIRLGRELALHLDGFDDVVLPITPQHMVMSRLELVMKKSVTVEVSTPDVPVPERSPRSHPVAVSEQRERAIRMYNDAVEQYDKATKDKTEPDQLAAEQKLREAAAIDPNFPEPHRMLARIALKRHDWAVASRYAEDLLRIDPNDEEAVRTVYLCLVITRNHYRVGEAAKRFAMVDPGSIPTIEEHAQAFYTNGQYPMARAMYEALVEVSADQVTAYLDLGICCSALGDSEGARAAFETFLKLAPENHPDIAMVRDQLAKLPQPADSVEPPSPTSHQESVPPR